MQTLALPSKAVTPTLAVTRRLEQLVHDFLERFGRRGRVLQKTLHCFPRRGQSGQVVVGPPQKRAAIRGRRRLDVLEAAKACPGARQLWLDPAIGRELANELADRLALQEAPGDRKDAAWRQAAIVGQPTQVAGSAGTAVNR